MFIRALSLAFACTALAPLVAAAAPAGGYVAPRNAFGQPDIGGYWQNSTLTPMTRDFKLGARAAYSEAEAKALEAEREAAAEGEAKVGEVIFTSET